MRRFVGWLVLVAAAAMLFAAPFAGAQISVGNQVLGDSLVPDTLAGQPRYRFSPVYLNRIGGDVSSVSMGNEIRLGLTMPFRSEIDFLLGADEKHYRLQNRLEENKRMSATMRHTFAPDLHGVAGFQDTRIFNRSIAVGGGVQDFIVNDRGFNGSVSHRRMLDDNLRYDVFASGAANEGERAFKTDYTVAAGVNGGLGYNLLGDRIVVQARGALRETDERSTTVLEEFDGLGAKEDSVMSSARVQVADSIDLRLDYSSYNGEREFADQAQGSLGGQLGGAENVFEENETRRTRTTGVTVDSYITQDIGFKLSFVHDKQLNEYARQTTRFSRTKSDAINGSLSYVMPWSTRATVTFENRESLRDLGAQSVSSLNEVRKQVRVGLSHRFGSGLTMDLSGSSQILQTFYIDYEANPRDRDQVDTSVNLRMASQLFKAFSANVSVAYSASDFVNIDASQSSNNRTRELYEFRPGFVYAVTDKFTISQTYGLAIEYTDYDYRDEDNFLDRNLTLTNEFRYRPLPAVDFRFEYGYVLHNAGTYLPDEETGEELLEKTQEDRRDRTVLRVNYTPIARVRIFAENIYSRFEDFALTGGEDNVSTDGSIQVGTEGNYDWGGGRTLRFLLSRVKRFSPFGSELEKDYWDMRSEFNYPF